VCTIRSIYSVYTHVKHSAGTRDVARGMRWSPEYLRMLYIYGLSCGLTSSSDKNHVKDYGGPRSRLKRVGYK